MQPVHQNTSKLRAAQKKKKQNQLKKERREEEDRLEMAASFKEAPHRSADEEIQLLLFWEACG